MTIIEQHKIVEQLKPHRQRMNPAEQGEFEMLVKRDRDDEELDALARAKLDQLQLKYLPKRSKEQLESLWQKFQSDKSK